MHIIAVPVRFGRLPKIAGITHHVLRWLGQKAPVKSVLIKMSRAPLFLAYLFDKLLTVLYYPQFCNPWQFYR